MTHPIWVYHEYGTVTRVGVCEVLTITEYRIAWATDAVLNRSLMRTNEGPNQHSSGTTYMYYTQQHNSIDTTINGSIVLTLTLKWFWLWRDIFLPSLSYQFWDCPRLTTDRARGRTKKTALTFHKSLNSHSHLFLPLLLYIIIHRIHDRYYFIIKIHIPSAPYRSLNKVRLWQQPTNRSFVSD